jgi:Tfp pilus assembly ATPase PilU
MTPHEALWLIKTQLAKTDQNLEAVQVIQELVKTYTLNEAIEELGLGNELEHIKNHMEKVGTKDIQELEQNMCARYEWAEDDEIVVFYGLCEDSNENS